MSVRFAPSPTGTFHIGNFRTAWISHWWARELNLPWVVRFEDIDKPRITSGTMQHQLEEMRSLGLNPDTVLVQSQNHSRYLEAFKNAVLEKKTYPCFCSRKDVRDALEGIASAPHSTAPAETPIYKGRCRHLKKLPATELPTLAWRFRNTHDTGEQDFIIARTSSKLDSSGLPDLNSFVPAYNLACAIDDWDGRHSLLVRAWDLISVAPQQRAVQTWLAAVESDTQRPLAAVFHCALVTGNSGQRLEKRTRGITLSELNAAGISNESLIQRFSASFLPPTTSFKAGDLFGESREKITLGELGIIIDPG